jgi:hypothetical protein
MRIPTQPPRLNLLRLDALETKVREMGQQTASNLELESTETLLPSHQSPSRLNGQKAATPPAPAILPTW